jgi:hypothetical protein
MRLLRLNFEPDLVPKRLSLLPTVKQLPKCKTWAEEEGRRRLFWAIYALDRCVFDLLLSHCRLTLDRFVAVTEGYVPRWFWSSCHRQLTSHDRIPTCFDIGDVRRRLPVCGGHWQRDTPAPTPYLGVWDKAPNQGLSRRLAGSYDAFEAGTPREPPVSAAAESPTMSFGENGAIGSFAYSIEAMESLGIVVTSFLHLHVNILDRLEVSKWLIRFKELDLRLVK